MEYEIMVLASFTVEADNSEAAHEIALDKIAEQQDNIVWETMEIDLISEIRS